MVSRDKQTTKGRCMCGAIQYQFEGTPKWTGHCHCESCRRNTASPITTFIGVANDHYQFTTETPSVYESSPGVRRLFCSKCGTPVAYESDRFADEIHFYLAGLDDPESFAPTCHFHADERLNWFEVHDDLPRFALAPPDADGNPRQIKIGKGPMPTDSK